VLALDMEWLINGKPYLYSLAVLPAFGCVVRAKDREVVQALQRFLMESRPLVVMHNALADIPASRLNYDGLQVWDTMVMAHLLGLPRALKTLAYRVLGMEIPEYSSLVDPVSLARITDHLIGKVADPKPWPKRRGRKLDPRRRVWNILKGIQAGKLTVKEVQDRYEAVLEDYPEVWGIVGPLPLADLSHLDLDVACSYTVQDSCATLQLYHLLWPKVLESGQQEVFLQDMAALPMVVDMGERGMFVDRNRLAALGLRMEMEQDSVRHRLDFNPLSGDQVAEALRAKGVDTGKRTKSGKMATDKESLSRVKDKHQAVQDILTYREVVKLNSAFVHAILKRLRWDGEVWRLFPNLTMTRVPSGRLAAREPNVLAIPTRSDLGQEIRRCFYAPEGTLLMSLDYSQIELRVLAHVTGDEALCECYRTGVDVHSTTCSRSVSSGPMSSAAGLFIRSSMWCSPVWGRGLTTTPLSFGARGKVAPWPGGGGASQKFTPLCPVSKRRACGPG